MGLQMILTRHAVGGDGFGFGVISLGVAVVDVVLVVLGTCFPVAALICDGPISANSVSRL